MEGTPVWSHDGIICTGESYKEVVKLSFARGASLPGARLCQGRVSEGCSPKEEPPSAGVAPLGLLVLFPYNSRHQPCCPRANIL